MVSCGDDMPNVPCPESMPSSNVYEIKVQLGVDPTPVDPLVVNAPSW